MTLSFRSERSNTSLRALAAKVPAERPRITPHPIVPAEAPQWGRRVEIIPKNKTEGRQQLTNAMVNACRIGDTINTFCERIVSNKNREGTKQFGAASAVLYYRDGGRKPSTSRWRKSWEIGRDSNRGRHPNSGSEPGSLTSFHHRIHRTTRNKGRS